MEFRKYTSIDSAYRQKTIDCLIDEELNHGEWVVTEKLHGSNFSIWSDGTEIRYAKRTGFIKANERFYGYERVVPSLEEKMKELHRHFAIADKKTVVVLHGELYGGLYPHPDVSHVEGATSVQKGVWYNPDNGFYAFDLMILRETKTGEGHKEILDYNNFQMLMEKIGFFYAKKLFRGSFDQCLNYSNTFQTTIPDLLGLPKIEDNICEGVVIKPVRATFFRSGERVILKNKNERWSEKGKKIKVKTKFNFSPEAQNVLDDIKSMVTENRLRNVLSKIGPIGQKEFGRLLGEMNKDILVEFNLDSKSEMDSLNNDESKRIHKMISQWVAELIRPNFQTILDGNF